MTAGAAPGDDVAMVMEFLKSIGAVIAGLLGSGQLVRRDRSGLSFLSAMLFYFIMIWQACESVFVMFPPPAGPVSLAVQASGVVTYSFTGPLTFMALQWTLDLDRHFSRRLLWSLFPSTLVSILYLGALAAGRHFFSDTILPLSGLTELTDLISLFLNLVFAAMVLFRIRYVFRTGGRNRRLAVPAVIFIGLALSSMLLDLVGFPVLADLSVSIVMFGLFLLMMRFPDFMSSLKRELIRARYTTSQIRNVDVETVERELMRLMDEDQIYRDENLSLRVLAGRLGLSPHQLSEYLNVYHGEGFFSFINRHRVKQAARLLLGKPGFSVTDTGYESGFNSNSAYYRAFKKVFGVSPGRFREKPSGEIIPTS